MTDYRIFGGILRSEIELPELPRARAGTPTWHLMRGSTPLLEAASVALGREEVEPGVSVALHEASGALRLVFDDTGAFDISCDGREIRWSAPPAPDMEDVRKDILGRVFALCLEQAGMVALHGSAVQLHSAAVAFLAPKFHGKSTTAAALVESGARLLADDIVAVSNESPPHVLPSVPVVQLWHDSADRVTSAAASFRGAADAAKVQLGWDPDSQTALEAAPLAGVYLLAPQKSDAAGGVRRQRLGGVEAALAMLGQAKVGALLGVQRRATLMQRLGDLAAVVPVYRLEVPRDFARIGELTSALWSWHDAAPAANHAIAGS